MQRKAIVGYKKKKVNLAIVLRKDSRRARLERISTRRLLLLSRGKVRVPWSKVVAVELMRNSNIQVTF